ncbi:MAG: DUF1684 domain-containing protein [Bacteroidetes bacterium]|nr:MAG: DUF1684 domain-containing protein [Bacteroidota bacterium]
MRTIQFITLALATALSSITYGQDINDQIRASLQAQAELDSSFADRSESPLTESDFKNFTSLPFFPVDTNWIVECTLIRTPDSEPFEMPTSTNRRPVYRVFGELHFTYGDSSLVLNVYQNLDLIKRPGFEDYLFLPFGDETNGNSTYGGGRYLDLRIPEGDTIVVDFNRCYHPLCAYNNRYSCPKIPFENILNVPIKAGVKYEGHH